MNISRELRKIAKDLLIPSEALFGFGGWLTTREEEITMSGHHNASPVADAIAEFCKVNDLDEPRDNWTDYLTHPPDAQLIDFEPVSRIEAAEKKKEKPTKEEITRRRKKTISVKKLAEQINGLRQKVTMDMKSDDEKTKLTATAVALMDCTAERVGNDSSAGDDHVGVTGFKKKNVTIIGNKVKLKYVGKSGVDHEKEFTDERIAKVLKQCMKRCKSPNDFVLTTPDDFKIKAAQVNNYLKEYGVTAKDIRGYAANYMVITSLKNRTKSSDEAERKKTMSEVLQKVAEAVGHGKGTLRKHYLLPNIEDDYVKKGKIPSLKQASMILAAERVAEKFYIAHMEKVVAITELARQLTPAMNKLKKFVDNTYESVFGCSDNLPERIELRVGEVKPGKIGSYKYDEAQPYGIMTLSPAIFDRGLERLCWVIVHELAHAAMGNTEDSDNHGPEFQELATALGIPKQYQD